MPSPNGDTFTVKLMLYPRVDISIAASILAGAKDGNTVDQIEVCRKVRDAFWEQLGVRVNDFQFSKLNIEPKDMTPRSRSPHHHVF